MKPNVILINIDDMGYGDLGCYGSTINQTPCIDQMAADGMRFTDFYAAAPVCTPSRAGMLTGCYPKRINCTSFDLYDHTQKGEPVDVVGVLYPGQPEGLHPDEKTIAHLFKESGYTTKVIGKWHLGDQEEFSPLHFGFDSYLGLPYSNDMGILPKFGMFKKHNLTHVPLPLIKDQDIIEEQPDLAYLTELYTNEAISYIKENKNNPFFLYFAHTYVHHPLYASARFMKDSKNGAMGAALAQIDWSVASIQYELEQLGLSENTLIILVSDNGGGPRSSNAPLKGFKGSCWEGGQRVACIMKWPAQIKPNATCKEPYSMVDFFETFAELTQVNTNDGITRDGVSMMPTMKDPQGTKGARQELYYYDRNELHAIRHGDYKYHVITGELYNLRTDIAETNDISASYPAIVQDMQARAAHARVDLGDAYTNTVGANCREKGFVKNYKPLATIESHKPYLIPLYDLDGENARGQ